MTDGGRGRGRVAAPGCTGDGAHPVLAARASSVPANQASFKNARDLQVTAWLRALRVSRRDVTVIVDCIKRHAGAGLWPEYGETCEETGSATCVLSAPDQGADSPAA